MPVRRLAPARDAGLQTRQVKSLARHTPICRASRLTAIRITQVLLAQIAAMFPIARGRTVSRDESILSLLQHRRACTCPHALKLSELEFRPFNSEVQRADFWR